MVDADLTSATLPLASVATSPGQQVFALGNPEGLEKTISQGIVSGIRQENGRTLLQITSPLSHGSSGGPVLNSRGEVVGVAVGMFEEGQNLNFAVPIEYLRKLMTAPEGASETNITPSEISSAISALSKETYSEEPGSIYQKRIQELRSSVVASSTLKNPASMREILCLSYSKAPDTIGDANIELGKKLLRMSVGETSEIHAVIAYDLAFQAENATPGPEQNRLITESKEEALASLRGGKQAAGTAQYVTGRMLSLEKRPAEALLTFKKVLGEANKSFACGYDLETTTYRGAIDAATDSNNSSEAERLFAILDARGDVNGFDWDSEGDRRTSQGNYLAAADAYAKSEDFFPINACFSTNSYYLASGDHNDKVLSEGRKCIAVAAKLSSDESGRYVRVLRTVHKSMAAVLSDRGVYSEALSHAKDSVSLDPKYSFAYYEEARALQNLGRTQECIAAAQQSIILSDGKYAEFHFMLGNCYFDAENWAAAVTSFRSAAEGDKTDASAAYNLGLSLKRQGFGGDAKHWFEEALKRNPTPETKSKIMDMLR